MTNVSYNNGFENKKSLNEQVNDIINGKGSRKAKMDALVKLGFMPNEISFILPVVPSVPTTPRFRYTFGVEIETAGMNKSLFINTAEANGLSVYDHMGQYAGCHVDINRFKLVPDGSIQGYNPAECVTPALDGNTNGFAQLKACCDALNLSGAQANYSCGLHVHIGAAGMTGEQYVNVFKNYQRLEAVIDSFMARSRRGSNCQWAHSLRGHDFNNCHNVDDVVLEFNGDRYQKVNPCSYGRHKTIEFRQHQGSTNYTKIKNWVNFCAKLVAYSMNNVLDSYITSIDEIPFLNATEKRYFKGRAEALSGSQAA